MNESKVSVLIVSFNSWDLLDVCLRSVLTSGHNTGEILVVDNASVDETPEKLRAAYPEVRLVENDDNIGHTRAVNQGLRLLSGEYILLLDADTDLRSDAIAVMVDFLDKNPEVCMAAPRILNSDGTIQETTRKFPSMLNGIFGRQSLLTRLFPNNSISQRYLALDTHDMTTPFPAEHVSSACMLFRRSIIKLIGEWDEGFVGYWNDADWCIRIYKAGEHIYCVPRAIIVHNERNSRYLKKSPYRIKLFHAGAYRFYRLHYTLGAWDPRSLFSALMLTARAALLLILNMFKKSQSRNNDPLSR